MENVLTMENEHAENPATICRKVGDAICIYHLRLFLTANELAELPQLQNAETLRGLIAYLAKCNRRGVFDDLRARLMDEKNTRSLMLAPFLRYYLNEAEFDRTLEKRKRGKQGLDGGKTNEIKQMLNAKNGDFLGNGV